MNKTYRFYTEFAPFWPLVSPVADYQEEGAYFASLFRLSSLPVREVLELGCGGGHCSFYLRQHFLMTLTDISEEMLAISRRLNPMCQHERGDMRSLRLGRQFDAVFIHDAIDYMTTEEDLRAALTTAFIHCRPGGLCVIAPDHTRETFTPDTDWGGSDGEDGSGVRFLEWSWDPDPTDDWAQAEYSFVFRGADGSIKTAHESHRFSLFYEARWLALLQEVGFSPKKITEETTEDRTPRSIFLGHRPQ